MKAVWKSVLAIAPRREKYLLASLLSDDIRFSHGADFVIGKRDGDKLFSLFQLLIAIKPVCAHAHRRATMMC